MHSEGNRELFFASSDDGGRTFSPNLKVGSIFVSVLTSWHLPGIFSHLPHVGFHRFPCSRGIAVFHRFQNPFVMVLSSLRSAFHLKNSHSLFPQEPDNGINQ